MNLINLIPLLPSEVHLLLERLWDNGWRVGLIGGVTRDFLISGKVSKDIDCELRPIKDEPTENMWEDLFKYLKGTYNIDRQAYDVLSLEIAGFTVALNRPRIEIFSSDGHHKNFDATFINDLNYGQGFQRRDFTINAIMLELYKDEVIVIDPLNGQKDIEVKILRACGVDFSRDPVRFLRALRFKTRLNFEFDEGIKKELLMFGDLNISPFYYREEFHKSENPLVMLTHFAEFKSELAPILNLPAGIESLQEDKSIVELVQIIVIAFHNDDLTDLLLRLFGVSRKKNINFKDKSFKTLNLYQCDVMDEEFKSFVDWFEPIFNKLSDKKCEWILNRSSVKIVASQLLEIRRYSPSVNHVIPSDRKYVQWKLKLTKVLE